MKISCNRAKNLSYVIIDEFFTEEELVEVTNEIHDLKRFSLSPSNESICSAKEGDKTLKTGSGLFLDRLYVNDRNASAILKANRKLFDPDLLEKLEHFDSFFSFLVHSNQDNTLLNYYADKKEYLPHRDLSIVSAITFLQLGDFTGGDFCFPDQNETVQSLHNRMVVFPSCVLHTARPVYGEGIRVSIAQFVRYKPN